ncbi:MAG: hypothetical protein HKP48_09585 [Winogradskyella sp.]|uniref:hypothetical protein n=1 Tax=Winogradskyella sp. TaxID=1883156 RepID=UPI00185E27E3|nr:hypothetical protein [Winogradskyella sp.]MBT8244143.1 hypothetical protein [Winogradskyella sp.]NNK23521.1 hypothetical protein [Winogradskyella sp.]
MNKYLKLLLSLLLDAMGYVSFVILGIGEFSDIVWAPLSGFIMTKLYKGKQGRIAGVISFVEEAFPFSDVVPTFTLMWIYTYLLKSKKKG